MHNSISAIDVGTGQVTHIVTRITPQVFITPDGRHVYVANQGTEADPDNTVSVIGTDNNNVIATIETGVRMESWSAMMERAPSSPTSWTIGLGDRYGDANSDH